VEAFLGESDVQEETSDALCETDSKQRLNQRSEANIEARCTFIAQTVKKFFGRKRKETLFPRLRESSIFRVRRGTREVYLHTLPAGWKDISKDVQSGWVDAPQEFPPVTFPSGSKVRHPAFGLGTVQPRRDAEGRRLRAGAELRDDQHLMVFFGKAQGLKTLDLEIAKTLLTLEK
jgi:hypothetical protein